MKKRKTALIITGVLTVLALFAGCGEQAGEKEYTKAMSAWNDGDLARAKGLLQKSIRKTTAHEKKSFAWNQLGLIHWQLGEINEAADAFDQSCNLTESITGANLNLGIAYYHAGKLSEAEVALNNVLGQNPQNQTALAMLGMVEMQERNWAGASQEFIKSVKTNPSSPSAQNILALAELHNNRNSETALKRLKKITTTHPDYAPAAYNLGVIYDLWLQNKSAAQQWYKVYLSKADPTDRFVNSANEAISRLTGNSSPSQATASNSFQVASRYMADGSNFYRAKKYKEAAAAYQKVIQMDSRHKDAYYSLGSSYLQLKKYSDAAAASKAAVQLDPTNNNAIYNLSLAHYYLKNWKEAERAAKDLKNAGDSRGDDMMKYISAAR